MFKNFGKTGNKGVTLYITLVILAVFLTVIFTLTTVSLSQIKISWQAGDSAKAFFAADTGIEHALFNIRKNEDGDNISTVNLSSGSSYSVDIVSNVDTATIQSKGVFRKTQRSIKANY